MVTCWERAELLALVCLILIFLISHWYPRSDAVLDFIDSWASSSFLHCIFIAEKNHWFFAEKAPTLESFISILQFFQEQLSVLAPTLHYSAILFIYKVERILWEAIYSSYCTPQSKDINCQIRRNNNRKISTINIKFTFWSIWKLLTAALPLGIVISVPVNVFYTDF